MMLASIKEGFLMARNEEAIKILTEFGSGTPANKEDLPESFREFGWDKSYSLSGGPLGPEGRRVTQLYAEFSGLGKEINESGLPPLWSDQINYVHVAFVSVTDGNIHRSRESSGPDTGDATNPLTPNNTKWDLYAA